MVENQTVALADNWAYLRVELSWLDRLLRMAVARQRQEVREIDRVAKSKADQATSHWWKGLISLEKKIGHDDKHQPQPNIPGVISPPQKNNYQQQLEARIQASYSQGIVLGITITARSGRFDAIREKSGNHQSGTRSKSPLWRTLCLPARFGKRKSADSGLSVSTAVSQ